ncbi:GAF and ANTAR domain-containing protein [Nocardia sp. XZ_19_385]|uniref:GAF and ANTAR domain-containing protein n=1 Tax=Nocardia sp. XZ_19_385 TaxID=2769488 RepID=UPI00188F2351|nr:GAF and ANTAR domain-containing protein [Nocardia sp. XZ_19_385]
MTSFDQLTTEFLSALYHDGNRVDGLCTAAAEVLSMQRAAIAIDEADAGLQVWCASDKVAADVEALQSMLGEGPGVSAIRDSVPVLVPDLAADDPRWPGFLSAVADKDITGAMYALPLHLGAIRLGVLDIYCAQPGPLERRTLAAGLHVADLVTTLLLSGGPRVDDADWPKGRIHAGGNGQEPGTDGAGPSGDLDGAEQWWWEAATNTRDIHQAAGMVIAQTGSTARDAYALLRGYAFAEELSMTEVATRVVRRQLRFGPENN